MRGAILILSLSLGLGLSGLAWAEDTAAGDGQAQDVAQDAGHDQEKPKKPSEVRAEQLDVLLARLYKSDGNGTDGLEQKIWQLWSASDSATAEVLLQQAQRAMSDAAPSEALTILDRLIGAYPDFAEAWNKRATLYFMMHRDTASLSDISKVLELEPRHFGALAGRGMIYMRQKRYSEALEAFNEALKINPGMEAVKASIKELERLEQGI